MLDHLKAVWRFRYFWMSLVKMDLRSRYRRSVLGIGWSLLHPLSMSAVFCFVFSGIMKGADDEKWSKMGYSETWMGYAAFLLIGMTTWDFFRNSLANGCTALITSEAYIRQAPLPYGIYPLRVVLGTGIHFLIGLGVCLALVSILKGSFSPLMNLWVVLPAIVMFFFFAWGVATIAAFVTVFFHDTKHMVEVGSQLMFFLTPIIYGADRFKEYESFLILNPVYPFIDTIRTPLVAGIPTDPTHYADFMQLYAQSGLITLGTLGLAFGIMAWLQKKVIFEL